ncbi:hypothetical protein [Pseudomonas aeruginosa]|uniref:hypothetical protein n=1 Tax=Pseudomonas aeruginosa TaxID=287 RepID=UPI001F058508|nr:hypothetical protein [Pseudomonas aeruginosa]EKX8760535.1 hypothetical protein [Pseudomonas aeruginosa]MCH0739021.1 hypothetical protein [Pseudomonas aeruginosa]
MANQQFHDRVHQVAAGDIKNFIEAPKPEPRVLLSTSQRQALNALVEEVSKECERDPRALWREVVHAKVGVDSVGDILRDDFNDAQEALIAYRDNHRRQLNMRLMVGRITSLTKEKNIYNERDGWCLRQFGEKHLNAMTTEQLRLVLGFVEDYQPSRVAASAGTASFQTAAFLPTLRQLVSSYPLQCGSIALALILIGKVI